MVMRVSEKRRRTGAVKKSGCPFDVYKSRTFCAKVQKTFHFARFHREHIGIRWSESTVRGVYFALCF